MPDLREVHIQEIGMGRAIVTVNGVRLSGVRAVRVDKRVNDMDVVTVELLSERTTVLPAPLDADEGAEPDA